MVIPFRTIAFDPHAAAWGINFGRSIRRKNEETLWNSWARNQNIRRLSGAGLLEGLSDLSQGHGLTLQPYMIGKYASNPVTGGPASYHLTGGGDITYSITPQIKANVTINTDFAETEVDQRQVNLTQFSLFFPEKRTFFLEGANYLAFGREPDNMVLPYFSRSIGLNSDGSPQRIEYGAKVTGQIGKYDIGFLDVRTANSGANAGQDFGVFRGRRRFLRQSYAGLIYTRKADRMGTVATSSTAGADFSLASSRFRGTKNLDFSGFYLWNSDRLNKGANHAWGMRVDYPNDRWTFRGYVRELGAGWNPSVGFLLRNNIREYDGYAQFAPRPPNSKLIRRFNFNVGYNLFTDLDNVARSGALNFQLLGIEFQDGEGISFDITPSYESPASDFAISKGVILPKNVGYNFFRAQFSANSSQKRKWGVFARGSTGTFYSGTRKEVNIGINQRWRPGLLISTNYEWNRVELTQGAFTTNTYRLNAQYQLNPRIGIANNLQYDNVSRVLGWQARFRWIAKPGNDVFVVYSQNWLDPIDKNLGFITQNKGAATKIVYTYQF